MEVVSAFAVCVCVCVCICVCGANDTACVHLVRHFSLPKTNAVWSIPSLREDMIYRSFEQVSKILARCIFVLGSEKPDPAAFSGSEN